MKFLSFRAGGKASYGIVDGGKIIDLSKRTKHADLKSVIVAGALADVAREAKGATADYSIDQITFDPTLPNPDKIICLGLNYDEHINETGMKKHGYQTIFTRWADTQVGHLQPMIRPKNSDKFDWEAELVVVVSKHGRHVSEADAMSYVAGYSAYNEGSVRDYQRFASQFTPGKNFPGTGSFGPWMVTPDEFGPLPDKRIQTRLNGNVMQDSTLGHMIFNVQQIIAFITSWTYINPGDVIVTGTPGGVGWVRNPPVWMKAGDTVEVEIDGIGILKNPIKDEA